MMSYLFIYLFSIYLLLNLSILIYLKHILLQKNHQIPLKVTTSSYVMSTQSLNRRQNLSWENFSNKYEQIRDTYTFVHTLIKKALKEATLFLCREFSGVFSVNTTRCRFILRIVQGHCKYTHFQLFLLEILKDSDNLRSLGVRSHIFGPRNKHGLSIKSEGIYLLLLYLVIHANFMWACDGHKYII